QRSSITWILAALLAANLGLLWVQGAQLNRQHQSLRQLHSDIEDLADALDAYTNGDNGGDNGDGGNSQQDGDGAVWAPARHPARAHRARLVRAGFQDPDAATSSSPQPAPNGDQDMMAAGRKDQEDANKSVAAARAKAREDVEKLSISENYRKGQEERKIQEAQYEWTRWVWAGLGA